MKDTVVTLIQGLNNRELAVAIWIFIVVFWVISQPNFRKSLIDVIKSFFAWKLVIFYVLMMAYIIVIVLALSTIGFWKPAHLSITILWGVFVAFVMLFDFSKANNPTYFKESIKDNFKGLIVLEFFVNLFVFALWIELILVPLSVFLGGMLAIAESDEKYGAAKKFLNVTFSLMTLVFIGYTCYMVVSDFSNFATLDNLENFYMPILLSILFLPFVYFLALCASYDTLFIRLSIFVNNASVLRYAKKKTLFAFNINLWELNKWAAHINTSWRFKENKEVDEAILGFKNAAL